MTCGSRKFRPQKACRPRLLLPPSVATTGSTSTPRVARTPRDVRLLSVNARHSGVRSSRRVSKLLWPARGGELGFGVSALTVRPCGSGGHCTGTRLHPNLGAGPAGFPVTSLFPAIPFPGHPGTRFCPVSRWTKAGKIKGEQGFQGLTPMSLDTGAYDRDTSHAGRWGRDRRTREGPLPPPPEVRALPSPRPSAAGQEDPAVGGREDDPPAPPATTRRSQSSAAVATCTQLVIVSVLLHFRPHFLPL